MACYTKQEINKQLKDLGISEAERKIVASILTEVEKGGKSVIELYQIRLNSDPVKNRSRVKELSKLLKSGETVIDGFTVIDENNFFEVDIENKEILVPVKVYERALKDNNAEIIAIIESIFEHELTHLVQVVNKEHEVKTVAELELEAHANEWGVLKAAGLKFKDVVEEMFGEEEYQDYVFSETELNNALNGTNLAEVKEDKLKAGDTIKLFSQLVVGDKHLTLEFKPQSLDNLEGPSMPAGIKEGDTVKLVKYGEYKDEDMEYDVVYLDVDGKKYYEQPSGTPYHITRFINTSNGIKPFMTGQHAKTQSFNKNQIYRVYAGKASYVTGVYNPDFNKTKTNSARIEDKKVIIGDDNANKLDEVVDKTKKECKGK